MIRSARPGDLNALNDIEERCFSTDRLSRSSLRRLINVDSALVLVDEQNGPVTGYGAILLRKDSLSARLYSLAVSPDWRGHGTARHLLVALERAATDRGRRRMYLEVSEKNPAARQLYTAQGYKAFKTVPSYYGDGSAAIRMEKILNHQPGRA